MTPKRNRPACQLDLGECFSSCAVVCVCVCGVIGCSCQPAYISLEFPPLSLKCRGIALRRPSKVMLADPWRTHLVLFLNTASSHPYYTTIVIFIITLAAGLPASPFPQPLSLPSSLPRSRPQHQAFTTTTAWHHASSQTHPVPVYPLQHGLPHPQRPLQSLSRIVHAPFTSPLVSKITQTLPSSSNGGLLSRQPPSQNPSRQYPIPHILGPMRRSPLFPVVVKIRPNLALSSTLVPTIQKWKVMTSQVTFRVRRPSPRKTRDVVMPSRNCSLQNWAT